MDEDELPEMEADDTFDIDDADVDEYVIRVSHLAGYEAGVSVVVGDITVPVTEQEEAFLRDWLNKLVLAHSEVF